MTGRRRFTWTAGGLGTGLGVLYVVLAGVAPDLMGTKLIGSFSLGFAGGVLLIVVTWVITIAYRRRRVRHHERRGHAELHELLPNGR